MFTLERHDLFPCRVMVGQELEPKYWFSKASFQEGIARFACYGTFWGDRPSIHQLLEMVRSGTYSFRAIRQKM